MSASERLELEAERNRVGVAAALVELRERLRPGQLTDDVLSYAGGQTGQLLQTFGRSLAKNPVPALLVGAGIAWLFVANRDGRDSGRDHARRGNGYDVETDKPGMLKRATDSIKETASDLYDRAAGTAEDVGDSITETARAAKDRATELGDSVAGTARRAAHDTRDAANRAATATAHAADDAWAFLKDQPLLLAGLGLALGSAAGAALPRTPLEDRLVGQRSDRMKERAEGMAADGLAVAKEFGEKVLDATAEETRSQLMGQQPSASGTAYGGGGERSDEMQGSQERGSQYRGGA